jgi:hypothetical protein
MSDSLASASDERRRWSDPRSRHNEDASLLSATILETKKGSRTLIPSSRLGTCLSSALPECQLSLLSSMSKLTIWCERLSLA